MASHGRILSQDDLESYEIAYRSPVRGTYRGYEIVGVGPASSGATHIIQALNSLEGFDLASSEFGSSRYIHIIAETLEIIFADRFEYMGDPDFVSIPVSGLTSKHYGTYCRSRLDLERASTYAYGKPNSLVQESDNTDVRDTGNYLALAWLLKSPT